MAAGWRRARGRARAGWLLAFVVIAAAAWAATQQFHLQVGWRVVAAVAAAAAPLVVSELRERFKQDDELSLLFNKSLRLYSTRHGIPTVGAIEDLGSLGVTSADKVPGTEGPLPPYVARDKDPELERLLDEEVFVLLVGESKAGKSRMAAEAIRRKFPDRKLLFPRSAGALAAVLDQQVDLSGTVIWLDDTDRFLPDQALDRLLDRLVGPDHPTEATVVGSIRANLYRDFMPEDGVDSPYWATLKRGKVLRIKRLFSDEEQARTRALYDSKNLLAALGRYGLAEYLAAGPDLVKRFEDGFDQGTPGAVVVLAVAGWTRTGTPRPLPEQTLKTLLPSYAGKLGVPMPSAREIGQGVKWAKKPVQATTSLLTVGPDGGFHVFDYLLEYVENDQDLDQVPDATWEAALASTKTGDDLLLIGFAAMEQQRPDIALRAFGLAVTNSREVSSTLAAYNYAVVRERQGELDDAETYYRRAADAGHVAAAYAAGRLLQARGDLAAAKTYYLQAAEDDSSEGAFAVGLLLRDGYLPEADADSGRDVEAAIGWLTRASDAGHLDAAVAAGRLLAEQGDPVGAELHIRRAADAHSTEGAYALGLLLRDRGDDDEALRWLSRAAESGHAEAARAAGRMLDERQDHAGAERFFRLAVEGPEQGAPAADTGPERRRRRGRHLALPGAAPLFRCDGVLQAVQAREYAMANRSDAELRQLTDAYQRRLRAGEEPEALLPEAFATVREAVRRLTGERLTDAQLTAGTALALGHVAVLRAGEGPAGASLPAVYLAALADRPVHVLSRTDSEAEALAERSAPVLQLLGQSAGIVRPQMTGDQRRIAYTAQVTYGPYAEFAFDHLRDNLVWDVTELTQRGLATAVVQDAAEIMLDEARTTVAITKSVDRTDGWYRWYEEFARIVGTFQPGRDYELTGPAEATPTESGIARAEDQLGSPNLYEAGLTTQLELAVRAKVMRRDVDYVVQDGRIVARDPDSGQLRPLRLWRAGLVQALQVKEGLPVSAERKTISETNTRAFLRRYDRLCGLVDAGGFELDAFRALYGLDLVEAPSDRPSLRVDHDDEVYASYAGKLDGIAHHADESWSSGRPVLIDVASAATARDVSWRLAERSIEHTVLGNDNRQDEARILAAAGARRAVTVAIGADYQAAEVPLGGPDADEQQRAEVAALGGLLVVGAERGFVRRHEDRLRDLAGRHGEPGESVFLASFEDQFFRAVPHPFTLGEEGPFGNSLLTRAIRSRQRLMQADRLSREQYGTRFDDILERHRAEMLSLRNRVLAGTEVTDLARRFRDETVDRLVTAAVPASRVSAVHLAALDKELESYVAGHAPLAAQLLHDRREVLAAARRVVEEAWDAREEELGPEVVLELARRILLQVLDRQWENHLVAMEELLEVAALEAAGGDVLGYYSRRAAELFETYVWTVKEEMVGFYLNVEVTVTPAEAAQQP